MIHHRSIRTLMFLLALSCATTVLAAPVDGSFAEFDRRAKAGDRLNVVFFGASLTWGANATDPQLTSYRGQFADRLVAAYPQARFRFWDAAIGGTGSQLGVFRLDRDVLRHRPDLVLVDFSANDDIYSDSPEALASYEAIVRRIIVEAKAPVVQVVFPFQWNVTSGKLDGMKRREAHHAISQAYGTAIGDAIELAQQRVKSGETTSEKLWPVDGVHPGDVGYELFTDAAWSAFQRAVKTGATCRVPESMVHADTYMTSRRVRLSSLGPLPEGWRAAAPNVVAAYFDMLMSRWLEDETVASAGKPVENSNPVVDQPEHFKVKFRGSMLMIFGESTTKSCKYRAIVDGKRVEHRDAPDQPLIDEFDAGRLGRTVNGNTHLVQVIAEGLDPTIEHTLEIEALFEQPEQELRIESVCVAGPGAQVTRAD